MENRLTAIGKLFRLSGEIVSYSVIKNGNINTTYKVDYKDPEKSYVFQKINTFVFKNPIEIMANIDRVTTHIRSKCNNKITLHFHHTDNGENYVYDEDRNFWRVMNYIESVTFDICSDPDIIRNIGKAFGEFQMQLADFDGSLLHETIPEFHNTKKRLDNFFEHVKEDPVKRVSVVREEINYIEAVREKACELCQKFNAGEFPVRVTHNDTKSNNVLFDANGMIPLVVIDLDTVMPGMSMYDFGDAVRSIANTSLEDESDLSKVSFNTDKFKRFCEGYIGQVKNVLTENEIDNLVLGAFSITIELASRFLDDYITGDKYFKINYSEHNLDRGRCQLHLAKDIMSKYDELCAIINEVISQ